MKRPPFDYTDGDESGPARGQQADYEEFEATELYCPKCGQAVPVRKSLLLILPEGDKYEYRCRQCGSTVGDKMDKSGQFYGILKT
ncbi:MAG: cytoplasmic protein [Deltaproteobacteria bacterium]|nr:cytoplasmic protein [Deltaproteobacteria bacterium]MBW2138167.1 cytoplasmic protein [Deltaproteobacteria bacterium]